MLIRRSGSRLLAEHESKTSSFQAYAEHVQSWPAVFNSALGHASKAAITLELLTDSINAYKESISQEGRPQLSASSLWRLHCCRRDIVCNVYHHTDLQMAITAVAVRLTERIRRNAMHRS